MTVGKVDMQLFLLVSLALTSGVCGLSSASLSLAPANATVSVGITVKLGCVASAAAVKCQWSHNNKLINTFDPSNENDCSLLIKSVMSEHSGHYRCAVTPKGSRALRIVSKKAFLKVIDSTSNEENERDLENGSVFLLHSEQNLKLTFAPSNINASLVGCTWIRPPNTPEIPPSTKSERSCEQPLPSERHSELSAWPGQWSLVVHMKLAEGTQSFLRNFTLSNLPFLRTNGKEDGGLSQILHSMWFLSAFLLFFTTIVLLCLCCKRGSKEVKRSEIVAAQSFVRNPMYTTSNLALKTDAVDELKNEDDNSSADDGQRRYAYSTIVSEGLGSKLEMDESYEEVSRPEPPYENAEWNNKMNDVIEAFDSLERKLQGNTDEKHIKIKDRENDGSHTLRSV